MEQQPERARNKIYLQYERQVLALAAIAKSLNESLGLLSGSAGFLASQDRAYNGFHEAVLNLQLAWVRALHTYAPCFMVVPKPNTGKTLDFLARI